MSFQKMTWNYRVFRIREKSELHEEVYYEVREVYYNNKGHIETWTEDGINPFGETFLELQADICNMMDALDKPILEEIDDGVVEVKEESHES
jgi:hypothetical protein